MTKGTFPGFWFIWTITQETKPKKFQGNTPEPAEIFFFQT